MSYLRIFYPELISPVVAILFEILIIWLIAIVNILGVRTVGVVQIITTIIKLLPIILVMIIGAHFFHPEYISHSFNISGKSNLGAFSYAAMLTLWAFSGQETACIPASSVDDPNNIRRATIIGTIFLVLIYIFSTLLLMGMFPPQILSHLSSPFASAAGMVMGGWGHLFVVVCVVISCLGALNSGIMVEGQIPMAIAEDGLFPKIFAKRNRFNVPGFGLAIDAAIMSLFILLTSKADLVEQFQLVITIASVALLISYLYSAMAEVVLIAKARKCGENKDFDKMNITIAIAAAIYACWAIFGSGKEIIFYMTMMIFGSMFLYGFLCLYKAKIVK